MVKASATYFNINDWFILCFAEKGTFLAFIKMRIKVGREEELMEGRVESGNDDHSRSGGKAERKESRKYFSE